MLVNMMLLSNASQKQNLHARSKDKDRDNDEFLANPAVLSIFPLCLEPALAGNVLALSKATQPYVSGARPSVFALSG